MICYWHREFDGIRFILSRGFRTLHGHFFDHLEYCLAGVRYMLRPDGGVTVQIAFLDLSAMPGSAAVDFGRAPFRRPVGVWRQAECAVVSGAVDHNAHVHLTVGQQSHGEATYAQIEPVTLHRRGAVGQEPLHAA